MEVRNPFVFALSLLCLATSASLGVLVHDAALGYDDVAAAEPGDSVRFKASAQEPGAMHAILRAWSFQANTADLLLTPDEHYVIVVHSGEALQNGTWVIDGIVRGSMDYAGHAMTIVDAETVTTPLFFA